MKTGRTITKTVAGNAAHKTTLHKANRAPHQKRSAFSLIFTSMLGGGSFGLAFGVLGVLLGAAAGGLTGAILGKVDD